MIQDYSRRYSSVLGGRQRITGKKGGGNTSGNGALWKATGVMLASAACLGILASYWFGNMIDNGLGMLARQQERHSALSSLNQDLAQQRNHLLSRGEILAAAAKLGLYPPSAGQVRRP